MSEAKTEAVGYEIKLSADEWIEIAERRADAAEAREAQLIKALEPFAGIDTPELDKHLGDDTMVTLKHEKLSCFTITLGDLRRATLALPSD